MLLPFSEYLTFPHSPFPQSASKATKAKGGNVSKKIRFSLSGKGSNGDNEGEEEDGAGEEAEKDPVLDMVSLAWMMLFFFFF